MGLNTRSIDLLKRILDNNGELFISEVLEKHKISKRTLYYDLNKINYWLSENFANEVDVEKDKLVLPTNKKEEIIKALPCITEYDYELTSKERIALIALNIFLREEALTLENLSFTLNVSKNTVLEDIKRLRQILNSHKLKLCYKTRLGYFIDGDELDKRNSIMLFIYDIFSSRFKETVIDGIYRILNKTINRSDYTTKFDTIKNVILETEDFFEMKYTDNTIYELSLHTLIMHLRNDRKTRFSLDLDERLVIENTAEFKISEYIINRLKEKDIFIGKEDIYHIAILLLGAKITDTQLYAENYKFFRDMVNDIIDSYENMACVSFKDRLGIFKSLLLHIKPMYYRLKYGVKVFNPLTEEIKRIYSNIYDIAKISIKDVEKKLQRTIPDDEVAYIAIHLGGWVEREGSSSITNKRKILVVCPSGIATSLLLKEQILDIFENEYSVAESSVREYENMDISSYEAIVSTNTLIDRGKKIIIVSPIMSSTEKNILMKEIVCKTKQLNQKELDFNKVLKIIKNNADIRDEKKLVESLSQYLLFNKTPDNNEKKVISINNVLTANMIKIIGQPLRWEQGIELACSPLVASNIVDKDYSNSIVEIIKEKGLYFQIVPKVILAHAKPGKGVSNVGISMLFSRDAINFDNSGTKDINLIIVIAAVDNKKHFFIIQEILKLLSNSKIYDDLINVRFPNEESILYYINQNLYGERQNYVR